MCAGAKSLGFAMCWKEACGEHQRLRITSSARDGMTARILGADFARVSLEDVFDFQDRNYRECCNRSEPHPESSEVNARGRSAW